MSLITELFVHVCIVLNRPTRCSWVVTFISLLDYSTCFGRFLHPSSGVQLYMQPLARVLHRTTTFLRGRFSTFHFLTTLHVSGASCTHHQEYNCVCSLWHKYTVRYNSFYNNNNNIYLTTIGL